MTTITIDEKEYDISDPPPAVKAQLDNIAFVNNLIWKVMSFRLHKPRK